MHKGKMICVVFLSSLVWCSAIAEAVDFFDEDFSGGALPAQLELTGKFTMPGQAEVNPGGDLVDLSGGNVTYYAGEFNRQNVQTVDTDYSSVDFVYEGTVSTSGLSDWSIAFFGMGAGGVDEDFYGEPLSTPRFDASLWNQWDIFRIRDNSMYGGVGGVPVANATHRLRMSWDAATKQAAYAIDLNYAGGPMVADRIFSQDGSDNGLDETNSRLYFGGGNGLVYDDISVTYAPDTTIGTANLALHKPVLYASSQYQAAAGRNFYASHVTDGVNVGGVEQFEQEYWIAEDGAGSAYFILDLEEDVDIAQIALFNTHNAGYNDRGTQEFELFASDAVNPAGDDLVGGISILSGELGNTLEGIPGQVFNGQTGLAGGQYRYLKFLAKNAYNDQNNYDSPGLNEIQVFGTSGPISSLYWDGPDGSSWVDLNWSDPAGDPSGSYPAETITAYVDTNTINVSGNQAARRLVVRDGAAVALASGSSLVVTYGAEFAPGTTLTMGLGTTLSADSGNIPAIAPAGDVTIGAGSGTLIGAGYDDSLPPATPRVFTKMGAGTFTLDNSGGIAVVAGQTTFRIEGGTLSSIGTAPLGGSPSVELAGGRLLLRLPPGAPPADPPTDNLVLHLDAGDVNGDGSPYGEGAAVPTWVDKSGQGNDATQANSFNQPTYQTGGLGGLPVVRFDGDDMISTTTSFTNPYTIFSVSQMEGTQSFRLIGSQDVNWLLGYWGGQKDVMFAEGWVRDAGPAADTDPHLYEAGGTGTLTSFYEGGNLLASNNAGVAAPSQLSLGGSGIYGENSKGDVAEILLYNGALSDQQRNWAGAYLAGKYGLSTSYSYTAPAPLNMTGTDVTVTEDSTIEAYGSPTNLGDLTMRNGALTTSGLPAGITFTSTTIHPDAQRVGFDPRGPTSFDGVSYDADGIDANNVQVTIAKTGPSTWTISKPPANLHAEANWEVADGTLRLMGAAPTAPTGGLPIKVTGGVLRITGGDSTHLGGSPVELAGGTFRVEESINANAGPAGAISHWVLDETSGMTAADSAGTNDGTLAGSPQWVPGSPEQGVLDGALRLSEATGDHVNAGSGIDLTGTSFTVAIWAKREALGNEDWLFGQDDDDVGACNNSFGFGYRNNNQFAFAFWCDDLDWQDPAPDTQWHHWAGTFNTTDNTQRLYKDGVEVASRISTAGYNATGDFWLGRIPGGRNFDGLIDEAYVYNDMLSPEDIATMAGSRTFDMSDTPLLVSADSRLEAETALTAPFGVLTLNHGVLTTAGATGGIRFQSTTITDGAASVGWNTLVATDPGVITHEGIDPPSATIRTNGAVPLVLSQQNVNLDDDVFQVEGGTLRMVGTAPWGGSTQTVLAGGVLALADVVDAPGTGNVPADAIAAHWSFDDGTAIDNSGNGNHGTTWGGVSSTGGMIGGALRFNGTDGYISVPDDDTLDTGETTSVAMWARWDGGGPPNSFARLVTKKAAWNASSGWGVNVLEGNDDALGVNGSAGDNYYYYGAVDSWSAGGWHHLVVSFDGGTASLYVDGQFKSTFGVTPIVDNNEIMNIARYAPGGHHWNGALDEIYVYDRALSMKEALEMYAARTAPDTSNVDVTVTADSGLLSESSTEVTFASLTMKAGILNTAGISGFHFTNGTTIDATATAVGFDPRVETDLGVIDIDSPEVTIAKTGPGDMVLRSANVGTGFANATFSAQGGRLIGVHGSNPFDVAALEIDGGELVLAGAVTDVAVDYDNSVTAASDGTLTAGAGGGAGAPGPVTVNVTGGLDVGQSIVTLGSTDDYTLNVSGPLSGAGGVNVARGEVAVSGGGSVGDLSASGGVLNVAGVDLNVLTMGLDYGAVVNTGANRVIVEDGLRLRQTTFSPDVDHALTVSGEDLLAGTNITIAGGVVSVVGPPSPPANIPPGFHAHYSFDDGTAADDSGNVNDGTIFGGATPTAGVIGGALDFDGVDDYVLVADSPTLDMGSTLSVAFWARWDSGAPPSGKWPRLITKKAYWDAPSGWGVNTHNDDDDAVGVLDSAADLHFDNVIDSWSAGEWHHIVVTYDGATGSLYTEGQLRQTFAITAIVDNDEPIYIARYAEGGHDWEGPLDEIYIYPWALSGQEVSGLYTSGGSIVDVPDAHLVVTESSTLAPDTLSDALFGNLSLAADAVLTLAGAPVISFNDMTTGHNAEIVGTVRVRGNLNVGDSAGLLTVMPAPGSFEFAEDNEETPEIEGATYRCEIDEWDSENVADPWSEDPVIPVNDKLESGGDVLLGGSLELTALSKLSPPQPLPENPEVLVQWYGDQARTIISTEGEASIRWTFQWVPEAQPEQWYVRDELDPDTGEVIHERNWDQGHLGYGVFLTRLGDGGANTQFPPDPPHVGLSYVANATQVHVFQACDGDTNGDRNLNSLDIQNILGLNKYLTGEPANWIEGNFNAQDPDGIGRDICDSKDIQLLLATALWNTPQPYSEPPEIKSSEADGVAELILAPGADGLGSLQIDTHGLSLTSYVVHSPEGVFTGQQAANLGMFQQDDDFTIGGAGFGVLVDGTHDLGTVIGTGLDALEDLSFTYTVQGVPGVFEGRVSVVPEPGTVAMLAAAVLGLLLAIRRRRAA